MRVATPTHKKHSCYRNVDENLEIPKPWKGRLFSVQAKEKMMMYMENLGTPRRSISIATRTVRNKYARGKTAVITEELRRCRISLLDLCETRCLQSEQVKLASGESILYSGHPDDSSPHTERLGFMLFKEAQRDLISWEIINSITLINYSLQQNFILRIRK